MSQQSALSSKRKPGQRRGGVGFKNIPDDDKPMSKDAEEKRRRFENLRRLHYHNEFLKGKNLPPLDDEADGETSTATGASSSRGQ
ncbi:hypothetical protein MTO96_048431 [Rhipicephalus appendiculatus]